MVKHYTSAPNDRPIPRWCTHEGPRIAAIHVCPTGEVHVLSPACVCQPGLEVSPSGAVIVHHRTEIQQLAEKPIPDCFT